MTGPRYFVLTAGETAHDAIDFVEARGRKVIRAHLTPGDAIPVYGICEIEPPKESE